ncbi:uncharacterized protein LOC100680132 isoform X2 [Nasonia vitripennis]|nr:uncharacterized protein LOC100680132 isoform X2 [Nasonia vitripennis]XP_031786245.1 uncharacterized protein LOC100680132 isoform X2 [Nasonia vitripennis]XP_031786246.1 uncharacterized protein LOC100680132 isoform X2 [Nasonia vitripennis]XP_031786247.1 uncharacterized protein LOC100680132 isoform X2 [Nasonia vitripennis]
MTLHWWMHWFWVTAQIVVSLMAGSRGATSEPPTSAVGSVAVASEAMPLARSAGSPAAATGTRDGQYERTEALARLQQSYRIAKAIGIQPTPASQSDTRSSSDERTSTQPGRTPGKKETKITWIQAFSKAPRPESSSPEPPTSGEELLTVMPLRELLELREDPRKNAVRREQPQLPPANRSGEESLEPRALATAASIIEGIWPGRLDEAGPRQGHLHQRIPTRAARARGAEPGGGDGGHCDRLRRERHGDRHHHRSLSGNSRAFEHARKFGFRRLQPRFLEWLTRFFCLLRAASVQEEISEPAADAQQRQVQQSRQLGLHRRLYDSGQLRGDVQPGQRLLPEFARGDDHPELLDRQRQAHEAMTNRQLPHRVNA